MRLTCPNCDAKYEVPDEVIPTDGRDVQCSNCGQTWFQHHPDHPSTEDDDLNIQRPDPDEEVAAPPPPPSPPPLERRQLDPAVAGILRQEAEAEHEARRKRLSQSLETQPDLGLPESAPDEHHDGDDAAEQRALEAKRRMARMRGEPEPTPSAAHGRRRELLPDIEEINSTLRRENKRSASDADAHGDVEAAYDANSRGGFKTGFYLVLLLAALASLVYVFAPQIAERLPQSDPYLSTYVTWVDQMRVSLDVQLQRLLVWLDEMASGSGS